MRKLLIKLNIFALLLILPLQGCAAAGMVLCHKMNGGSAAQFMQNKTTLSADMPAHCHTASDDNKNTDASNSICPHCFTCGIYAPAVLPATDQLTVEFDTHIFYADFQSRFTSFIPQSPLHPPSVA